MLLGRRAGDHWGPRVEIVGGLVLIGIGVKILAEHLGGG
jgi:putative Mn2+ efflux pump MntP